MIGGLGNCPLCWDDPEICRCPQSEIDQYYDDLQKRDEEYRESQRKMYHDMLDKSFNDLPFGKEFPLHLAENVFKKLNKYQWLELRKQFDRHFDIYEKKLGNKNTKENT